MKSTKMRIQFEINEEIGAIAFNRYPDLEWGLFFKFGFRDDPGHGLVITIADLLRPNPGDLNTDVANVQFLEPYLLRAALSMQNDALGIGVIHSHPEDCEVAPSPVDDEMDAYLSSYFADFGSGRPFASLIFSQDGKGNLRISGRVFWEGEWLKIETITIVGSTLRRYYWATRAKPVPTVVQQRLERFTGAMGRIAAGHLWNSSVVIIGVGGTGSAAAHSLARSCVGRIVLIDSDLIAISNAERVHGCEAHHLALSNLPSKVSILRDLIRRINPKIEVIAIAGNCLQNGAYEELIHADLALGCTDTEHGRAVLGELAHRYLIPGFQVNVVLEPEEEQLGSQIIQFTSYRPGQPCAYCRDQVDPRILTQELMSDEQKELRQNEAIRSKLNGGQGDPYWRDLPVVPTVGSLTTIAGELAANFTVGMLTDRFGPPAEFLEMDLLAPNFGIASVLLEPRLGCACKKYIGFSDQTPGGRIHLPANHWKPPQKI